jgi:hypothetical protein
MIDLFRSKQFKLLAIHAGIALVIALAPTPVRKILLIILYGWVFYKVLTARYDYQALAYIFFVSGLEIFTKVSKLYITWEWSKQFIILLLIVVIIKRSKSQLINPFFFYALLLLPGLFLFDIPDLKGSLIYLYPGWMLALGYAIFSGLNYHENAIYNLYRWMLFGFVYGIVYLLVNAVNLNAVSYGHGTASAAVGFSGNQFTNAIAAPLFLIFVAFYFRLQILAKPFLAAIFLVLFYQGLTTVSRGGMLSFAVSVCAVILYTFISSRVKTRSKGIAFLLLAFLPLFWIFNYVNERTNDSLLLRFTGKSEKQDYELRDYSSGRFKIDEGDWITFVKNPVTGVGITNSGVNNEILEVKSHNEFMRHLSEHGLFGVFALVVFFVTFGVCLYRWRHRPEFIGFFVLLCAYIYQGSTRVTPEFMLAMLIFLKPVQPKIRLRPHAI